ncbi:hypothetical protein [Embleya scabrispora]|uniref:hypothetical protein n=1 Tax=Embleya scabrispora TaxID=159449 RepID=UPI001F1EFB52|nr:hypothetical protein [Embleya scabrispora]
MTATPHLPGRRRQRPAAPSRCAGIPARPLAVLVGAVVALIAALFVVPPVLAEHIAGDGSVDQDNLAASFRAAFVEYWGAGRRDFTPGMDRAVDYWFRFHVVKAVIAAILLVVVVALGMLVWRAFLRARDLGTGRRAGLAAAGVFVTMLGAGALATTMANIQGAVAPFSSLLTLLPSGAAEGELGETLRQVREGLDAPASERTPPALDLMIDDFARYHAALAVVAALVAVVLIGLAVVVWRRFAATDAADRRARRLLGWFGVLAVASVLVVLVVVMANVGTTADPKPALAAFFEGGW